MAALGPRIRPVVTHDEEGQLITFTGKHCATCGLLLTSRNRYSKDLLCIEHGKQKQRERKRLNPSKGTRAAKKPPGQSISIADEAHRVVHYALSHWLRDPTDSDATERLQALMMNHEMRCRIQNLLPWVPTPAVKVPLSIPVEEPCEDLGDPTRRLMFIAACEDHGV